MAFENLDLVKKGKKCMNIGKNNNWNTSKSRK